SQKRRPSLSLDQRCNRKFREKDICKRFISDPEARLKKAGFLFVWPTEKTTSNSYKKNNAKTYFAIYLQGIYGKLYCKDDSTKKGGGVWRSSFQRRYQKMGRKSGCYCCARSAGKNWRWLKTWR